MFRKVNYKNCEMDGVDTYEDQSLTEKIRKLKTEGGQIESGAPIIYCNRTDPVAPACNIRTNRWELAQEAMHKAYKAKLDAESREKLGNEARNQEAEKVSGNAENKPENDNNAKGNGQPTE